MPDDAGTHSPPRGGTTRIVALDGVRAWAMFLGVALHAALCFMVSDYGFSPRMDASRWLAFDIFVLATHAFRMQLFFFVAGFFASLVVTRRGVAEFLRGRLLRIGVPLMIATVVLVPLVNLPFILARQGNGGAADAAPTGSFRATLGPAMWDYHSPRHLWFLLYLMVLTLAALGVRALFSLPALRPVGAAGQRVTVNALTRTRGILLLVLPAIAINLLMCGWPVDTPDSWLPDPVVATYYLVFFACGWAMHASGAPLERVGRRWWLLLGAGLVVLLPALIVTGVARQASLDEWVSSRAWPKTLALVPAAVLQAFFTWCMILGTIGLFMRALRNAGASVAYLADSAYWVYLVHLPIVYALQVWLNPWGVSALIKFPAMLAITLAACLLSYQVLVRHTFIGMVLNGSRREKPAATQHAMSAQHPRK